MRSSKKYRVVLCDDHSIVRAGIKSLVEGFPDFEVMGDVDTGEAVFPLLRKADKAGGTAGEGLPDVLLLDISLPGRSGLEVLKQVRSMYPSVAVLALSMYPEDQFAIRMIKAGAMGYLHKDSAPDVLEAAMRSVADGKQYISADLTRLMIDEMSRDDSVLSHQTLSDREYEVLLYIGEGKTMTEIAGQLSLSIKTVSTYRSRILDKMRLNSNSDLVKYILLHDLAPGGADPTVSK